MNLKDLARNLILAFVISFVTAYIFVFTYYYRYYTTNPELQQYQGTPLDAFSKAGALRITLVSLTIGVLYALFQSCTPVYSPF